MKTWVGRILAKFLLERMMIQTAGETRQKKDINDPFKMIEITHPE